MIAYKSLKLFIITVFAITYLSWISAAIISNVDSESFFISPLHLLGGASPLIASIVYLIKTKEWKFFWHRWLNFREVHVLAWVITLSPIIVIMFSSIIVFQRLAIQSEFIESGVLYAFFLLFFGPIPEEIGWRGILFHDISKVSFKKAQLYVMLIWLIWHLPLFFIVGTYQNGLGILSIGFVFFVLNILIQSLIMGYLYLIGHQNIVLPILFHYFVNLTGEMFNRNTTTEMMNIGLYSGLLLLLVFVFHTQSKKNDNLF